MLPQFTRHVQKPGYNRCKTILINGGAIMNLASEAELSCHRQTALWQYTESGWGVQRVASGGWNSSWKIVRWRMAHPCCKQR